MLHRFLTGFSAAYAEFRVGAANLAGFGFRTRFLLVWRPAAFAASADHLVVGYRQGVIFALFGKRNPKAAS
jgi:hypothetical protein